MDRATLDTLLDAVAAGQVTPSEAAARLGRLPFTDLRYAKVDTHRLLRTGLPEVVYAPGKTLDQIHGISGALLAEPGGPILITRASSDVFDAVRDLAPEASWNEVARTIVLRAEIGAPIGSVGVVTAGTSDLPVAEEAAVTLEAASAKVDRIVDVGVAGLHRLLSVSDRIRDYDALIVVAGMEGALPSIVGGMVPCPVIAVPTSVGYGSSFGGLTALLAMLNSCAPGIAVVNIDNGFGAAALAVRMLRASVTTLAFFDCFSGIAGDMVLGALLDAGVPLEVISGPLGKLPLEPFQLEAVRVERLGITATSVRVRASESGVLRTYASVRALLADAPLPPKAQEIAMWAFERLAQAEAKVHGKDIAHVPFHELGSVDTIVDVVGAALGLNHLGVERVHASAVATGMGMMKTEHGVYPIPGPAVVELLKGVPIYSRGIPSELVTPTGAAILAATAVSFGDIPPMRVDRIGYGAGTRELDIPNVLRLLVGESADDETALGPVPAVVLEANIDDMNPEFYEYVLERLFTAGAQDAWVTPITMKRGRPAATLNVLCGSGQEQACRDVIFAETTTLGLRRRAVEKWTLPREVISVELEAGTVRVKIARSTTGSVTGIAPEYADCAAIARESGVPLKQIFSEAHAAAQRLLERA